MMYSSTKSATTFKSRCRKLGECPPSKQMSLDGLFVVAVPPLCGYADCAGAGAEVLSSFLTVASSALLVLEFGGATPDIN